MTYEQVLNSVALKKRFCKDANVPITVFDEPYFSQRLELLDDYYGCVEKFVLFAKELEHYPDEQSYFEFYNSVKDSVINMIKENEYFLMFNNVDFGTIHLFGNFPNKNLYTDYNNGKHFISIDMKKANFSALRFYNPQIFKNADTWEQYIGMFTNCKHIINSKYIRQVILGACNPKKQIQYERYLTSKLAFLISQQMPNINIFSVSNDEIIIENPADINFEELKNILNCDIGALFRMELFELNKFGDYGWIKYNSSEQPEIKCADVNVLPQIVRYMNNQEPEETDLVFRHDHMLARFLKPIENPWR